MIPGLHDEGALPGKAGESGADEPTAHWAAELSTDRSDQDARRLIVDLAAAAESGIRRAQELMRLRDLEDLLERSAEAAIDAAASDRGASAIDAALSSVAAAREAKHEQDCALGRWIEHIERVAELLAGADRLLGLQEQGGLRAALR